MFNSKRLFLFIVALFILLSVTACSKSKKGTGEGENAGISEEELALQNSRFGEGNIPMASDGGPFKDVLFEFNSSQVAPSYFSTLEGYAKTIRADSELRVEVEGHCDKRGTTEFNMVLGQKRAKAVAAVLSKYGVPSTQISIVSYGEEIPLDPSDSEDAYAQNRRVHFAVYKAGTK